MVNNRDLGRRIAKSAGWTVLTRLTIRTIGFVSTIILARLLLPADFGLVALATLIVATLDVMSEFSLNVSLIVHKEYTREHYDTAWTMMILRGLIFALLLWVLAEPMAAFFGDVRLVEIIQWLCLSVVLMGFLNIATVDFQKHLHFEKDFVLMAAPKVASFAVTVSCAFLWRNYWALVAGILTNNAAKVALSYIIHPFRPRLTLVHWRELFNFSKWLMANNILLFVASRADTFILGRVIGATGVGIYTVAHEIANMVTSELLAPVRRVLLPGFAQIADDAVRLRTGFIVGLEIIMVIGTPVAAGIGLVADPAVRVLLGPNWVEAIVIIQILAVYGFFTVMGTLNGSVLYALKKPRYVTYLALTRTSALVPALTWAIVVHGLIGAAVALTAVTGVVTFIELTVVSRMLGSSTLEISRRAWRTGLALGVMVATVLSVGVLVGEDSSLVRQSALLLAQVTTGAVTYASALLTIWILSGRPAGPEEKILGFVKEGWEKIRAR